MPPDVDHAPSPIDTMGWTIFPDDGTLLADWVFHSTLMVRTGTDHQSFSAARDMDSSSMTLKAEFVLQAAGYRPL